MKNRWFSPLAFCELSEAAEKMHQPSKNKTHAFLPATQFIRGLQLHMKRLIIAYLEGEKNPKQKTNPNLAYFPLNFFFSQSLMKTDFSVMSVLRGLISAKWQHWWQKY